MIQSYRGNEDESSKFLPITGIKFESNFSPHKLISIPGLKMMIQLQLKPLVAGSRESGVCCRRGAAECDIFRFTRGASPGDHGCVYMDGPIDDVPVLNVDRVIH
jgi:hypothetical protein